MKPWALQLCVFVTDNFVILCTLQCCFECSQFSSEKYLINVHILSLLEFNVQLWISGMNWSRWNILNIFSPYKTFIDSFSKPFTVPDFVVGARGATPCPFHFDPSRIRLPVTTHGFRTCQNITLKTTTAISAETLENPKHYKRIIPDSWSYICRVQPAICTSFDQLSEWSASAIHWVTNKLIGWLIWRNALTEW